MHSGGIISDATRGRGWGGAGQPAECWPAGRSCEREERSLSCPALLFASLAKHRAPNAAPVLETTAATVEPPSPLQPTSGWRGLIRGERHLPAGDGLAAMILD